MPEVSYKQLHLFMPDKEALSDAGFARVAHVPCVFDSDWSYQEVSSRYLRARAKGEVDTSFMWAAAEALRRIGEEEVGSRLHTVARSGTLPTEQSLVQFARSHINFMEWCSWFESLRASKKSVQDAAHHDKSFWKKVTYQELIDSYAGHMSAGIWGQWKLAGSTVNSRVDEACYFLHWADKVGLRDPFYMDVYLRKMQRDGARSNGAKEDIAIRTNRARRDPLLLIMPLAADVDRWLSCVETEYGYVKGLMCRLMRDSAIRREECAQWRIWTLPEEKADWLISPSGESVTVLITHGAKGEKSKDEYGDAVGPKRFIRISIEIAEELHHYRDVIRPKLLRQYVNGAKTESERKAHKKRAEKRLFLSEYDGSPISGKTIYKMWTNTSYKPVAVWHPHLMRHYWAVTTLWDARCKALQIIVSEKGNVTLLGDWITGTARSDISLIVQPQLGHIEERTAKAYLVWLRQRYEASVKHDEWMAMLGEKDDGAAVPS